MNILSVPALADASYYEWSPVNIIIGVLFSVGFVYCLLTMLKRFGWARSCHEMTPRGPRLKTGCLVVALLVSVPLLGLAVVAYLTERSQTNTMKEVKVKFLEARDPNLLSIELPDGGGTATIKLLGMGKFEADPQGEAVKHLGAIVNSGQTLEVLIPQDANFQKGEYVEGYVITGSGSSSDLGVMMIRAGYGKADPSAIHYIAAVGVSQKSNEKTAKQQRRGLWSKQ